MHADSTWHGACYLSYVSTKSDSTAQSVRDLPRVLGDVVGARPGRTVILTGAIHGNEPAGAIAIQRVLDELGTRPAKLKGRVVGLTGNRAALARGTRFVSRDLNRRWYANELAALATRSLETLVDEDLEQRELFDRIGAHEARGPLAIVDLHTTSGESPPFVCFGDTLANRHVALALPMTAILGLEEVIDGAMLGYYTDRGHVAISVEAGQHDDPITIDRHVSTLWVTLDALGAVSGTEIEGFEAHRERLERAALGQPRVVEIRHRHRVHPSDDFAMTPGFTSFQRIERGDVVAKDRRGPVRAPLSGLMLMPRYQGQGEDGYFLVREVAPFWIAVSERMRAIGFERIVSRLPGVEREGGSLDRLAVDPNVARSFVVEVMHLCGYRRGRDHDSKMAFTRRPR